MSLYNLNNVRGKSSYESNADYSNRQHTDAASVLMYALLPKLLKNSSDETSRT